MGAEEALLELGMIGRWQIFSYIMICILFSWPSIWQWFVIVFTGFASHAHHCSAQGNVSLEESVPMETLPDGTLGFSRCSRYNSSKMESNLTVKCDKWDIDPYVFDPYQGTFVMEWNLVCDKSVYIEVAQVMFMAGLAVGAAVCGPFADWFGRRVPFFVFQLLMCIWGIAVAFTTNIYSLWACVFLTGVFAMGNDVTGFVLGNELFPADLRVYTAPAMNMFNALGAMTLTVFAYFIRRWRELQLAISIVPLVTIAYFFICPESVRWLIANGRFKEAKKQLDIAAKVNRVTPVCMETIMAEENTEKDSDKKEKQPEKQPTIAQYFKRKTGFYCAILAFQMYVSNLLTTALGLLSQVLGGSVYVNFLLINVLQLPGVIMCLVSMHFFGRRYSLIGFQMFCCVTLIIATLFEMDAFGTLDPDVKVQTVTAFTLITSFGVLGSWTIELVYIQEIFPTCIRTTGTGLCGGVGFLGSVTSPLALYLARTYTIAIPLGVLAGLSVVGAALAYFEPETMGRVLPTTIEDILSWPRTLSKEDWDRIKKGRAELKRQLSGQGPRRDSTVENGPDKQKAPSISKVSPASQPPVYDNPAYSSESVNPAEL